MIHALISGIIAGAGWLAFEIFGEAVAEVVGFCFRPVWQSIVQSGSSLPALAMLVIGAAGVIVGPALTTSGESNVAGILVCLAGLGLVGFAPLAWRDARREATRKAKSTRTKLNSEG